jgi:hypothetical protein
LLNYSGDPCKATALPELAGYILALGYPEEALTAYSAGLTRERAWVAPHPPSCERRYQMGIRIARGMISPEAAHAASERGRHASLAETVTLMRHRIETNRT